MKIFSNKEISEIIKYTIDHDGVSMIELVDRVGKKVADEIMAEHPTDSPIVIFAGWGLKGAYALAAARALLTAGYHPEIILFNIGGNRLQAQCANSKKFLLHDFPDCNFYEVLSSFSMPEIGSDKVVVDGLFGREIDQPLPKSFGLIVRAINESEAKIISIDIPSGLFSEWNTNNTISRDIIHADITLAIEFPALSFFMNENIPLVGSWKILKVGLSTEAIRQKQTQYSLVTRADVRSRLRHRAPETSKANYGAALICAGSYGMMGASVLAARGCLRGGAGKVTCYGPRCGYQIVQTAEPCAMYMSDVHETCISKIVPTSKYTAISIGPGIGTSDTTVAAVEQFLKMNSSKRQPLIIDADALNCIARKPLMLNYIPTMSVLTPHAGEFDRIFGAQPSAEARLRKAMEVAAYHSIIIVLKGHYTAIVRPDGSVYINSSGTPALATPGSGDVLTGVITALMAQDYTSETASFLGVYIHGLAGEIAEETHGSYGVTAADVADCVGRAIKHLMQPSK